MDPTDARAVRPGIGIHPFLRDFFLMSDTQPMSTPCSTCNQPLAEAETLYDEQGNILCQACLTGHLAEGSRKRFVAKVVNLAYGCPVLGLVGLVFNPFGILSLAAMGNGAYVLHSLKEPDTAALLGAKVKRAKVAAIVGIVLGSCSLTVYVFNHFIR